MGGVATNSNDEKHAPKILDVFFDVANINLDRINRTPMSNPMIRM